MSNDAMAGDDECNRVASNGLSDGLGGNVGLPRSACNLAGDCTIGCGSSERNVQHDGCDEPPEVGAVDEERGRERRNGAAKVEVEPGASTMEDGKISKHGRMVAEGCAVVPLTVEPESRESEAVARERDAAQRGGIARNKGRNDRCRFHERAFYHFPWSSCRTNWFSLGDRQARMDAILA